MHRPSERSPLLEELEARRRPPFTHRVPRIIRQWRHDQRVQFAGLFVLFVFLGAGVVFLLEGNLHGSPFGDFFTALWFTVVTITTVGYGDISPSTHLAQAWAMAEMLVGIGLVGVITGSVASGLVEVNRKRALGLVAPRHITGHIIICGWKRNIRTILLGILEVNPWLTSEDLLLVTTRDPADVAELQRTAALRGLRFVAGSHTDRETLRAARVEDAERVIILADQASGADADDADSRTVLAATTIEQLSPRLYTCTELIQPHYTAYLGPAGVEEVVLGQENARALLVAASLGEGIANVVSRFLPENGGQLRVLPIPPAFVGRSYRELERHVAGHGLMAVGLLENTGRLHDRRREALRRAVRQPNYRAAVDALIAARDLRSNLPRLDPPPEVLVPEHAKLLVLMAHPRSQPRDEWERRRTQVPRPLPPHQGGLLICGWVPRMALLLEQIVALHHFRRRPLERITVLSRMPADEAEAVRRHAGLHQVRLAEGEPTDPVALRAAGFRAMGRALVLTDPELELRSREADARNVLVSFALNEVNPLAYKSVELLNPNFAAHLRIPDVEEIVYTQRYQEVMLVEATLGTGLSSALGALFDPEHPGLQVVDFSAPEPGLPFAAHAEWLAGAGKKLVGVIDHSGNHRDRKREYLRDARSSPEIRESIDHLLRLKEIASNEPILNPGDEFVPGTHSRAVVIAPNLDAPGDTT